MRKAQNHVYLIILLAALSSLPPIATDTYIPSIKDIATAFHVSIEKIELTLSIFLIGFSIGQIFAGPISDKIGRRKSLFVGLVGFACFSFFIIFSSNVYELWTYRFFEAFFGGVVAVAAMATIRDNFHGTEAAKAFSIIGSIRSIAPLIAPAIGTSIVYFLNWQAVFIFFTIYALLVAFWTYRSLEEKFVYTKQSIYNSYKKVLTHKNSMKATLTLSLTFSGFFIFIAKSSFIFIQHYEISKGYFPLFFGFNFVVLILMIKVNLILLRNMQPLLLIKYAVMVQIIVGILWILTYNNQIIIITMLLMATYMSMAAFIYGNCMALALEHFQKNAGVASSVVGVFQFGLGGIISSIALVFSSASFLPIGASIAIISIISYLIIRTYK